MTAQDVLSEAGREQVAMALILLKDWKSGGRFDIDLTMLVLDLANTLGVRKEMDALLPKIPVFDIKPRS